MKLFMSCWQVIEAGNEILLPFPATENPVTTLRWNADILYFQGMERHDFIIGELVVKIWILTQIPGETMNDTGCHSDMGTISSLMDILSPFRH